MKAMILRKAKAPLSLEDVSLPRIGPFDVLIKVHVCGVCRTDLHIFDGELPSPHLPLILGHQVVGLVEEVGSKADPSIKGKRVGAVWLGGVCETCEFCLSGRENLCDKALFTGYQINGGYAEYFCAHQNFILEIPQHYSDVEAAPLLCAGLIGYRAYKLAGDFESVGFYGFGSSAHLLIQVAMDLGKKVCVFTRPKDEKTQEFARDLGAIWVGDSDTLPDQSLDAAIIFAPDGALYPGALKALKKGGRVISAGIHMSDIPSFSYSLLWEERSMTSVANLTREDGKEFMKICGTRPLKVQTTLFPLYKANQALETLRAGGIQGALVLQVKDCF